MTTDDSRAGDPGRGRRRRAAHAAPGGRMLAAGVSASAALGLMGVMAGAPATGTSPAPPAIPVSHPAPTQAPPAPPGEVVVIVVEVDEKPIPSRAPVRGTESAAPPASVAPPPALAIPPAAPPAPRPTVVATTAPPVTKTRAS